jgi:hypothetical protein
MSMKNYNDTIGNRNRDFPTCSAVPQPSAPSRTPNDDDDDDDDDNDNKSLRPFQFIALPFPKFSSLFLN